MFCTNCGRKNDAGAAYCENCGASLEPPVNNRQSVPENTPYAQPGGYPQSAPYTQPVIPPAYPMEQPPYNPQQPPAAKKKKTGLIVGLALGGVAVIAAIVLLVILTASSAVVGTWYCEERGVVLEFQKDGIVVSHTVDGSDEGNYSFDSGNKEGVITADDEEFDFSLDGREIEIEDVGQFRKAENSFDPDEFLKAYDN